MTTYTLRGNISDDGHLEVDLPSGVPSGEAAVTVEPVDREPNGRKLLAILEEIHRERPNRPRRTKEEVDAELNAMRDEWDNREI